MKNALALIVAVGLLVLTGCSTGHPRKPESGTVSSAGDAVPTTPAVENLLDHLVGKWVLRGMIGGKETTHDVDAEWVLNREYVRLHEVSRDRGTNGATAYEAIVFISWHQRAGECLCLWLDSTAGGGLSPDGIARGRPRGDTIPFVFNLAGGEKFRNTFIYDGGTGTWRWVLDDDQGGKLTPFARVTLTKTP